LELRKTKIDGGTYRENHEWALKNGGGSIGRGAIPVFHGKIRGGLNGKEICGVTSDGKKKGEKITGKGLITLPLGFRYVGLPKEIGSAAFRGSEEKE